MVDAAVEEEDKQKVKYLLGLFCCSGVAFHRLRKVNHQHNQSMLIKSYYCDELIPQEIDEEFANFFP